MNPDWKRTLAAVAYALGGSANRNRRRYDGGASGLRIVTFHAMDDRSFARFGRIVEQIAERFNWVGPDEADRYAGGSATEPPRDRVLLTFDDGHAADFRVARWLAERGIRAIFFVVPSFVDRSLDEYLAYHRQNGVAAHDLAPGRDRDSVRGLSSGQIREIGAMGHRIGAHNFAHRDLGGLSRSEDLEYEIGRAFDGVERLTGRPCADFAWGFGQAKHLSEAAAADLSSRNVRVYSCIRGRNVPGRSPRFFLRDTLYPEGSFLSARMFLEGAADHLWAEQRNEIARRAGVLPGGPWGRRAG